MCVKYYELRCMFKKIAPHQICNVLLDTMSKFALFSASGLKVVRLIKKSKPTRKLKHTNFILEYFEYFCEMALKSILIILSYTVSKLVRFFETQCRSVYNILCFSYNSQ